MAHIPIYREDSMSLPGNVEKNKIESKRRFVANPFCAKVCLNSMHSVNKLSFRFIFQIERE